MFNVFPISQPYHSCTKHVAQVTTGSSIFDLRLRTALHCFQFCIFDIVDCVLCFICCWVYVVHHTLARSRSRKYWNMEVKYNSSHDFAMEDFHPLTLQLTARSSKFSRSKICAELSVSLSRADGHLSKKSYEDLYFWFYSQYFLVKLNWKIPSW